MLVKRYNINSLLYRAAHGKPQTLSLKKNYSGLVYIQWECFFKYILTATDIYIATIICKRVAGKRSYSKMSNFDFAMTVAIGSIIATIIVSKSVSLQDGVIGLIITYSLQLGMAYLHRYQIIRNTVDNAPLLLMDGQDILYHGNFMLCLALPLMTTPGCVWPEIINVTSTGLTLS